MVDDNIFYNLTLKILYERYINYSLSCIYKFGTELNTIENRIINKYNVRNIDMYNSKCRNCNKYVKKYSYNFINIPSTLIIDSELYNVIHNKTKLFLKKDFDNKVIMTDYFTSVIINNASCRFILNSSKYSDETIIRIYDGWYCTDTGTYLLEMPLLGNIESIESMLTIDIVENIIKQLVVTLFFLDMFKLIIIDPNINTIMFSEKNNKIILKLDLIHSLIGSHIISLSDVYIQNDDIIRTHEPSRCLRQLLGILLDNNSFNYIFNESKLCKDIFNNINSLDALRLAKNIID